jgi:hypothetical protein
MERNNTSQYLPDEVKRLLEENSYLKECVKGNEKLRENLHASSGVIEELLGVIENLKQKNAEHVKEKKLLFNRIEQLKHRICDKDCVLCVIVRICQTKLGLRLNPCCRQLENVIIWYASPQIKLEDLKCSRLLEVLIKYKIVAKYDEYKYPPEMIGRYDEMVNAWKKLMTMDDSLRVVIIGRVISEANGVGHAELCDLDTRTTKTADGMVTIHDAQEETWKSMDQQDFINYVQSDKGVKFYTVIFKELEEILEKCLRTGILHLKRSDQTGLPAAASASGEIR